MAIHSSDPIHAVAPDTAHGDDGSAHSHVATVRFYVGIFSALVVLTILTVKVSYYDFGAANTVVALLIATAKASLVAAFFMHLRHDSLFNTLALLAAFLFLAIFILLTYDDTSRRGQIDPDYGGTIMPQTGLAAPGAMPATTETANEAEQEPPTPGAGDKKE
jgi:cytochrome c oxidase subunit 4